MLKEDVVLNLKVLHRACLLLALIYLNSCGPALFELKLVKNPTPNEAPQERPKPGEPELTLLQISKKETEEGDKSLEISASIDDTLATALNINPAENCLQVVTLSDGSIAGDIGVNPCPSSGLMAADDIRITLLALITSVPGPGDEIPLYLSNENTHLGKAVVDSNGKTLLAELCTGPSTSLCTLEVSSGQFVKLTEN